MEWAFGTTVKGTQGKPTSKIVCNRSKITQDENQKRIVIISPSNNTVLEFLVSKIMENKQRHRLWK